MRIFNISEIRPALRRLLGQPLQDKTWMPANGLCRICGGDLRFGTFEFYNDGCLTPDKWSVGKASDFVCSLRCILLWKDNLKTIGGHVGPIRATVYPYWIT